jgi:hypothetical protein
LRTSVIVIGDSSAMAWALSADSHSLQQWDAFANGIQALGGEHIWS